MSSRKVESDKFTSGKSRPTSNAVATEKSRLAAQQRATRREKRGMGGTIDWSAADPGWILALIIAATRAGDTVTFATTRDAGALKVTIYDGTQRYEEYCRPTEDISVFFQALCADYE